MADHDTLPELIQENHQIQLNKILDLSLDVICTIDNRGNFVTVSAAAKTIWNYAPEELMGKHVLEFVYPDDHEATRIAGRRVRAGYDVTNFKNHYISKNGTLAPMVWSARWDDEQKIMYCIGRDDSAQVKADNQLQLNEQRFKSLVQNGSDMIAILSIDAVYIYKSTSSRAISGWEPEEFIGRNATDFIHPADVAMVQAAFGELITNKIVDIAPFRFKQKDGSYRWMETILTNLITDPAVGGVVANSRDATERILATEKLKENEAKLTLAAEIAKLGYWQHQADGTNRYWSDEVYKIWDMPQGTDLDNINTILDTIHLDDRGKYFRKQRQYLENEHEDSIEYRILCRDGSVKWVCETGRRIVDNKTGEFIVIGTVQDVTGQKRLALSLEESNKRYQYATKATFDAIWDWNLETGSHYWGEGFEAIFGHQLINCETTIDAWKDFIHPEDMERVSAKIYQVIDGTENNWADEYLFMKADGNYAYVADKGFVIRNAEGKAIRMVGAMQDITERKKAEKELKSFADDLYKRNKELQEFGYIVSHNLRSPVANIMGIADLLEMDKEDPTTVTACASNLKKAIKNLDSVIKDLSNILSATDGSLMARHENIDLQEIINSVKTDLKDAIQHADALIIGLSEPFIIFSHKAYVYSILYNLISNAIKYRSERKTVINISITSGAGKVCICVRDNGIGLDLTKHGSDLFKPYKRFNDKVKGKGLGLFLVKSHIEALNGTLSVESEVGVGTAFIIKLPVG